MLRTAAAPPSNDIARLVARFDDQIRVQTTPLRSILEVRLQKLRFGPLVAATFGTFALIPAAASLVPARRAVRVDPVVALRYE